MIEQQFSDFKYYVDRIISLEEGGHMTDEEAWALLKEKFKELKKERKKLRKNNITILNMDGEKLLKGLDKFSEKAKRKKRN